LSIRHLRQQLLGRLELCLDRAIQRGLLLLQGGMAVPSAFDSGQKIGRRSCYPESFALGIARCAAHMTWEEIMLKLAAVAFALALALPAQAMPLAPIEPPDGLFTTVREACGVGFTRVNGVCVRTPARAAARRCAAGLRVVNGRCVR